MARLNILSITGTSPYDVYVADEFGNNETLVGTISTSVPPTEYFYLPNIFNNAPAIMVRIVDANDCDKFKIIDCTYGCGFDIEIVEPDCTFIISVELE